MDAELAKQMARGMRVRVGAEGSEMVVRFDHGFAQPAALPPHVQWAIWQQEVQSWLRPPARMVP
jgi:hypothetical protein